MFKTIVTDTIMGDSPFRFGRFDAKVGNPCAPEMFFRNEDSIVHYTLGFESVAGSSEVTKDLLSRYDSPDIPKLYIVVEWEMKYRNNPNDVWLPIDELMLRAYLSASYSDLDATVERMRQSPGVSVAGTPTAEFRLAVPEEAYGA